MERGLRNAFILGTMLAFIFGLFTVVCVASAGVL